MSHDWELGDLFNLVPTAVLWVIFVILANCIPFMSDCVP
jgi:hypothetical protein